MKELYIILVIFGIVMFYFALKSMLLIRKLDRYNEVLEISLPSPNRRRASFLPILGYKIMEFFSAVYDYERKMVKTKGIFIVLVFVSISVIINSLFLNFSTILAFIVGIYIGAVIAKKIEFKAIETEFENSFPEALVILNGAISSGNNIIQALQDASNNIEGILSYEFATIVKGLNIGDDPSNVFAQSYQRLPFKNYYFFLIALLVSMKSGAKLKEILSRLSHATTKAKSMERKKLAMTSEARMSSKITAAIPFAFLFLMKFISPDNFDYVMNDPSGRYILYYFLGSEFIGMLIVMFLMRKL